MASAIRHLQFPGVLVTSAGVFLGLGLAAPGIPELFPVCVLLALAVAAEWLGVRLGPVGILTMHPAMALVGLWVGGPGLFVMLGLLPPLLLSLAAREGTSRSRLHRMGRDSLGFVLAYFAYALSQNVLGGAIGEARGGETLARCSSAIVLGGAQIASQAVEVALAEGVNYRIVLKPILKNGWIHALVFAGSAVGLGYVYENFGLIIMALATIMIIEAYYPRKLLGEQGGVLLTSLEVMAQAVDLKDPYTSNHSQRVSAYAVRIARTMGLSEDQVERIRIGGLMHDIGKIGISGRIIRKPGKLLPEEQALMRQHSSVSADIIQHLEILGEAAPMVRHHHENWDGTGYPDGVKGEHIPLGARIIFVGDTFDALTTDRPYRKGRSPAEAVEVIRQNAGTQFDPKVVEVAERALLL